MLKIKKSVLSLFSIALLTLTFAGVPEVAQAGHITVTPTIGTSTAAAAAAAAKKPVVKVKAPHIPVIGKTADGKYKVYDLRGELNDFKYFTDDYAWKPVDLIGYMDFIAEADVGKGKYWCDWICKDGFQNVVGLNPAIKNIPGLVR